MLPNEKYHKSFNLFLTTNKSIEEISKITGDSLEDLINEIQRFENKFLEGYKLHTNSGLRPREASEKVGVNLSAFLTFATNKGFPLYDKKSGQSKLRELRRNQTPCYQ
ncbi:MAG: hypothetical protein AABY07_08380 [Nanoarchaeota archaeon]